MFTFRKKELQSQQNSLEIMFLIGLLDFCLKPSVGTLSTTVNFKEKDIVTLICEMNS